MKRSHAMPFGARVEGAATRFRIWAPACAEVSLEVGRDAKRRSAMHPLEGGWHELVLDDVGPGEAYAFRVRDDLPAVPDPASRSNPWGVESPSRVVDAGSFEWDDEAWRGRPWREAVIYEAHVGTFTPAGTYLSAIERLDHVASLGATVLELMPLADFPGRRNWGYDGVLAFAPASAYGEPEDLKRLVAEAHRRRLMVMLDVVYNHFGPHGNFLPLYAPQFFDRSRRTPWGGAIDFDGERSWPVREFYVHNALYWLEEFRFDGLRMDAVHAIDDASPRHIVSEIAQALADGPGRDRHVHLVLENDRNEAHRLERTRAHAAAQWNDDAHHAFHVLVTGEADGYYEDYGDAPARHLARCLAEGFAYQGEPSRHRRGERRGEPSAHLPPEAFVNFLQNHDQVGNRALGERLSALAPAEARRLASAVLCLAPSIPLLFMGEELGTERPFLFFCDFEGELGERVREGRRAEFAAFERFRDARTRHRIPDPLAESTFLASKLDWDELRAGTGAAWLAHYRRLLAIRAREIVPRLRDAPAHGDYRVAEPTGVSCDWELADGSRLHLAANFGSAAVALARPPGRTLHEEGLPWPDGLLPAWSGAWTLEET